MSRENEVVREGSGYDLTFSFSNNFKLKVLLLVL